MQIPQTVSAEFAMMFELARGGTMAEKGARHDRLGRRLIKRIMIDPGICHGKPCVRGLRYPVESVLLWLSAGMTNEQILADYPDLERDDILAVLAFAARLSQVKRITRTA